MFSYRLQEHHVHTLNSVEVAEFIDEFAYSRGGAVTERRFETPVPVMLVVSRTDDILKFMLECVEIPDYKGVLVIEGDSRDRLPLDLFELGVTLSILLNGLTSRP